jgi:hypothetical protein
VQLIGELPHYYYNLEGLILAINLNILIGSEIYQLLTQIIIFSIAYFSQGSQGTGKREAPRGRETVFCGYLLAEGKGERRKG